MLLMSKLPIFIDQTPILLSKCIIIILYVFSVAVCYGQKAAVYNINNKNGLSSNHVYLTHVDKLGYLWIATTDGVFRHNGYSLYKYDYSEGLPNTDVWGLYEDSSSRLWFLSIAQQIGYVKNNVFKRVVKKTNGALTEIYPGYFTENGKDLFFPNITSNKKGTNEIGIINNDTLKSNVVLTHAPSNFISFYLIMNDYIAELVDSKVYIFKSKEWLRTPSYKHPIAVDTIEMNYDFQQTVAKEKVGFGFTNKYYVYYQPLFKAINFFDITTSKIHKVYISKQDHDDEQLVYCFLQNKQFNCLTNKRMLTIDSNLHITYSKSIDSLFNISDLGGFANTYFINHPFWGNVLSTNNRGLFIKYPIEGNFKTANINLDKHKYLGPLNDSVGYWWDETKNILLTINKSKVTTSTYLPGLFNLKKISPYDSHKSILLNQTHTMWLYKKDNTIQSITYGVDSISINSAQPINISKRYNTFDVFLDAQRVDTNVLYLQSSGHFGLYKLIYKPENRKAEYNILDHKRYNSISVNKKHNIILCYTHDKILAINTKNEQKVFFDQAMLEHYNINGIEKIIIDNFGNVFIKDNSKLHVFNMYSSKVKTIFNGYKLEKAIIEMLDNTLTIAGSFGVIQCDVKPNNRISNIRTHPNIKNIYYTHLYDVQFSNDYLLLKTDGGTYYLETSKYTNANPSYNNFNFIVTTDSIVSRINADDTIIVSQTSSALGIDVIKPTGTGDLHIEYAFNKIDYTTTGNQIILPDVTPANYYTVSVIVSDNSWKSRPVKFYIYVEPKWWQTSTAKKVIYVLSIMLLIGLVYFTILLTRRIVNKNNDRRNQRRELELKSIYSQINPHFIFNSLSTAQYFVKKNRNKEAYEHINQFSDLLRAYIKSSRNKYISITEEVENLHNYLQLQLTRFEEKFDYHINVDKSVNPNIVKIPSLLLQPIVENALNHGIFHNEKKGLLNISFAVDKNVLICIVDDNGIGRKKSKEIRSALIQKASSYGTILINELIDTFNKYEKIKIEIEYIDKEDTNPGTTVIIKIENYTYV